MKVGTRVKISRMVEQEALRKTQENFHGTVTHIYDHPVKPKRRMLKVEKDDGSVHEVEHADVVAVL